VSAWDAGAINLGARLELAQSARNEHFIHNMNGSISERNSYGNDSYPPAG
jgi:hypothetical protein